MGRAAVADLQRCSLISFRQLTEAFSGLRKLGQFPDETRGLLVVGTEGEDSFIGGVGGRATLTGERRVVEGEGPCLDGETSRELIIQDATRCLKMQERSSWYLLCFYNVKVLRGFSGHQCCHVMI